MAVKVIISPTQALVGPVIAIVAVANNGIVVEEVEEHWDTGSVTLRVYCPPVEIVRLEVVTTAAAKEGVIHSYVYPTAGITELLGEIED